MEICLMSTVFYMFQFRFLQISCLLHFVWEEMLPSSVTNGGRKNKEKVSEKYAISLMDYWKITEPEKEELKAKQMQENENTKRNTQK